MVRAYLAALAVSFALAASPAAADDFSDLLALQATSATAVALAADNYCAALELKPALAATKGYLVASRPGGDEPATRGILDLTLELLDSARFDLEPCDIPCPETATDLAAIRDAPSGMAKYTLALKAIIDRYVGWAESDPPVLALSSARHSYDPLPTYAPGEPVSYSVHVGTACHGATLLLDRAYDLPSGFEGEGSFVPHAEGLWTIHLRRNDGIPPTPLLYLDADTGLRTYFKEFWVSSEPVALLGPSGLGPFSRTTQPIAPLPD
jgi:hypothetical protein